MPNFRDEEDEIECHILDCEAEDERNDFGDYPDDYPGDDRDWLIDEINDQLNRSYD